jgi:hypothetical protein
MTGSGESFRRMGRSQPHTAQKLMATRLDLRTSARTQKRGCDSEPSVKGQKLVKGFPGRLKDLDAF